MIIKLAIALAVLLAVAAFASWAFLPARYLPGNRARTLRLRLHLRLHPGRGFATVFGLWLHWGRLAALRRSRRIRRSLPLWLRFLAPHAHSVFLGRAHYRHALRVPLEEHLLLVAPPRTFKTAFLADVILTYPGAVLAATTKADVFGLTAAARARRARVRVFNPQGIGGVPSTFRWSPVAGCEDPATAIRRADAFASPSGRRASRTVRSGPPRPATTCAAISTRPRCPGATAGSSTSSRYGPCSTSSPPSTPPSRSTGSIRTSSAARTSLAGTPGRSASSRPPRRCAVSSVQAGTAARLPGGA